MKNLKKIQFDIKRYFTATFILFFFLIISACTDNQVNSDDPINEGDNQSINEGNNEKEKEDENDIEVEETNILVATPWSEESFRIRFEEIEKKMDGMSIDHIYVNLHGDPQTALEELFVKDIVPDIIIGNVADLDIAHPLDDLIEQYNFDLDMIEPSLVATTRSLDPKREGRLIGLPDGTQYAALYYNKDVFDLFGVPYPDPEEPMTWYELLDLVRELSGTRDGIEYVGFDDSIGEAYWPFRERTVSLTDPDTGEVLISEIPEFQEFLELINEFYSISETIREKAGTYYSEGTPFEERKAAMAIQGNAYLRSAWPEEESYESIDLAPIPVWEDEPASPSLGSNPMVINKYSEQKEEAFEVLMEYVSYENQVQISRGIGTAPVVTDEEVLAQFGADVEQYKGKNIAAYFATKPAIKDDFSRFDRYVDIRGAVVEVAQGDKDIPTIIRELEEESRGKIQDILGAE